MYLWSPWFHGLLGVEDSRKLLVFNIYQVKSLLGFLDGLSSDGRYAVANKPDSVVKD